MCGIAGYRTFEGDALKLGRELTHALNALRHRGPDDEGAWFDDEDNAGLGQRRLAIVDLSRHGHQPMVSACGQWVMTYNGEVYNFRELRRQLEQLGHCFPGSGDSEVILAAFSQWGLEAVSRFIGMFAIALWHKPTRQLHLLRDRLGVKPLYYHWDGKRLLFGSELKALHAFRSWHPQIDPQALADYLRYGYVGAPRSIYRDVFKLPPGHRLVLDAEGILRTHRYWNVIDCVHDRRHGRSEDDLADELEALMLDAFRYRMIADVPVGVFLSGGIDSSVVAALLSKQGGDDIKTYTIGFDVPEFDESGHAAAVARHLGVENHVLMCKVEDAKRVLPRWGDLYDEPFGDESGIPTLMVSQAAAAHVKVVLSADGGDELFSGYNSYTTALSQWSRIKGMPQGFRSLSAAMINGSGTDALEGFLAARGHPLPRRLHASVSQLVRIGRRVGARGVGEIFDESVAHFKREELQVLCGRQAMTRETADAFPGEDGEKLCLWDLHNYLPGDVLAKVDRATMAVGIEGREPMLDHRLVEFAFSLPFEMRRGPLGSKHLLKKVLYRHLPRQLVERPKQGFAVPVKRWLQGDLAYLIDEHLEPGAVARQGLFDPVVVQGYVKRLRAGDVSVQQRVWLLVAFQMFFRRWMEAP
ncbi:MAG TPA: asparagine synthase (glutamine-hydrolyzing) [Burkholderiaceae bacterium]|nr:asparagine synthase (glutamine-hydrolyzing) [Burkholderiaceae bacterium]